MVLPAGLVISGYLLGSVASAVVVCRVLGLPDPRTHGSGNPGATNVLRLYGRKAAAFTLAGDLLKGLLPVAAARLLEAPHAVVALTGAAAFTGHLFPVFFRFQGGKGVATLIGVLIGTDWMLGAAFTATWLVTAALFRYSSVSAVTAAVLTPVYTWLLLPHGAYLSCFSVLAFLLIVRHRSNIRNLINGTEGKIGTDAS
ncbi:MAG: glycerol-3-phosphate 1-O-acyltransferase PlsY [Gammaproteobacteria bacterium]|nr:glycerol-3-phosphate 1-O-acyltransferase PlsY [Gammaproteobacteria bacterium]